MVQFLQELHEERKDLILLINFFFSRRGTQHSTKDSPFKALKEVPGTVLRDEKTSRKVPSVLPKKD